MDSVEIIQDTAGFKAGETVEVSPDNKALLERLVERGKAKLLGGVEKKADKKEPKKETDKVDKKKTTKKNTKK